MNSSTTNEPTPDEACPICGSDYGPALLHAPACPVRIGFHGAPMEWGPGRFNEIRVGRDGQRWRYCHTWEPMLDIGDT